MLNMAMLHTPASDVGCGWNAYLRLDRGTRAEYILLKCSGLRGRDGSLEENHSTRNHVLLMTDKEMPHIKGTACRKSPQGAL